MLGSHLKGLATGPFDMASAISIERSINAASGPEAGRSGFTTDWSYSRPPPLILGRFYAPATSCSKRKQEYCVPTVHFLVFLAIHSQAKIPLSHHLKSSNNHGGSCKVEGIAR